MQFVGGDSPHLDTLYEDGERNGIDFCMDESDNMVAKFDILR